MPDFPPCAFWDFSLAVYGRSGVAPASLRLQVRYGADVNLLLFCCWLGADGRGALVGERLAAARGAVERWHGEVVRGLRAARQRLKSEPDPTPYGLAEPLRKRIAATELEAEHIEQLILAGQAPSPEATVSAAGRLRDAARGAIAYLGTLGAALDAVDRADLAALLAGAFPAATPAEIVEVCQSRPAPRSGSPGRPTHGLKLNRRRR
jgi:uncharacterized protein (TIGR02444 family)